MENMENNISDVNTMHGGAILKKEVENDITFADGVYQMIDNATKIEVISVDSLYGFVFAITCGGDDATKLPFNRSTQNDKQSIKNIILKMTILNTVESKLNYNGKQKRYQSVNGFNVEAFDMTNAYMLGKPYTYNKKRLSVSPDLLTHTILTGTYLDIFIKMLRNIPGGSENMGVGEILTWIFKQSNNNGVGVMFMEYAEPSSFQLFSQMIKENEEKKNKDAIKIVGLYDIIIKRYQSTLILSNMLLLLFEANMVHCDLHTNNVFIKKYDKNNKNNKKCFNKDLLDVDIPSCSVIIDFGRVIYINENSDRGRNIHLFPPYPFTIPDDYSNRKEVIDSIESQHISFYKTQFDYYKDVDVIIPSDAYVKYILQKLRLIYDTDKSYNVRMFGKEHVQSSTYFNICGLVKDREFIKDDDINENIEAKQTILLILKYLFTYYQSDISATIPTKNTYYGDPDTTSSQGSTETIIKNFEKDETSNKHSVIYNLKKYTIDLSKENANELRKPRNASEENEAESNKPDYYAEYKDPIPIFDIDFISSFQSAMLVGAMRELGNTENNNTELMENINRMIKEVDSDYSITDVAD
jgi:hypothetical protein